MLGTEWPCKLCPDSEAALHWGQNETDWEVLTQPYTGLLSKDKIPGLPGSYLERAGVTPDKDAWSLGEAEWGGRRGS